MPGEPLTRDDIREVECPACSAPPGERCVHTGRKSAKKNREGANHLERMHLAQRVRAEADDDDLIDVVVIDDDDQPGEHWFNGTLMLKVGWRIK